MLPVSKLYPEACGVHGSVTLETSDGTLLPPGASEFPPFLLDCYSCMTIRSSPWFVGPWLSANSVLRKGSRGFRGGGWEGQNAQESSSKLMRARGFRVQAVVSWPHDLVECHSGRGLWLESFFTWWAGRRE